MEASLTTRNLLYRKGASYMGTHLPFAEARQEPPQPAAGNQTSPPLDQGLPHALRRREHERLADTWLTSQRWPNYVEGLIRGSNDTARLPDRRPLLYRCTTCRALPSVTSHGAAGSFPEFHGDFGAGHSYLARPPTRILSTSAPFTQCQRAGARLGTRPIYLRVFGVS